MGRENIPMKRVLFLLLMMFVFTVQTVFGAEVTKITSVNFDTSNAMLVLTSPDANVTNIVNKLKIYKVPESNKAYFDLPNTVLTCPKEDVNISKGGVSHVVVAQNSKEPPVVRVVLNFSGNYSADNVSYMRAKNNIILKFNDNISKSEKYFQNTYREDRTADTDYYEYTALTTQVITKRETTVNAAQKVDVTKTTVNDIQSAFASSNIPKEIQTAFSDTQVTQIKKDLRLPTRYYLKSLTKTRNGILLSGFGSLTVERPLMLSEPSRVVYDLPNTFVNKDLRGKEFSINETETIKVGQFEANKARLVLKTDTPQKYLPIYSHDNETLLLADKSTLNVDSLSDSKTTLMASFYEKNSNNKELILAFNAPVVYSVDRVGGVFEVAIYNIDRYNATNFVSTIKGTELSTMGIKTDGKVLKFTYRPDEKGKIKVFNGVDGKSLKISVNEPASTKINVNPIKIFTGPSKKSGKVIVIDPGHGGVDGGATRAGITEKSINLDISQRVATILKQKGYTVYLTRNDDSTVSLQDRVEFAESKEEDIFVSIHVNSSEKSDITGIETHYYHDYSKPLADIVHKSMSEKIKSKNRGLFKSKFYVINHTTKPAILVEIGFISNEEERKEMISVTRKQKTAEAIAEGVINYFKEVK